MFILGNPLWTTSNGGIVPPAPTPTDPSGLGFGYKPSGGFPAYQPFEHDRPRTRQQISEDRKRFGLEDTYEQERVAKVIADVAARQAEALETDKQKQFEEFSRQLDLEGLEFRARYLEVLNEERQRLITEEIARRIHAGIREDEELLLLMMIAAASV